MKALLITLVLIITSSAYAQKFDLKKEVGFDFNTNRITATKFIIDHGGKLKDIYSINKVDSTVTYYDVDEVCSTHAKFVSYEFRGNRINEIRVMFSRSTQVLDLLLKLIEHAKQQDAIKGFPMWKFDNCEIACVYDSTVSFTFARLGKYYAFNH